MLSVARIAAFGSLFAIFACGGSFRERFEAQELPKLRTCAAFDFHCPADQLQLTELASMAIQGVSGCGRRATYVQNPNGLWIMNTDEQPSHST